MASLARVRWKFPRARPPSSWNNSPAVHQKLDMQNPNRPSDRSSRDGTKLFPVPGNLLRAFCCVAAFILSVVAASAVVVPADTDYVKSLDGTWRFKLERPGGYETQSTN